MCGNRVEELEEQVNQLQATVDGLTDELVECKVRIRELENAVDDDNGFSPDGEPDPGTDIEDAGPEPAEEANSEEPDASDEDEQSDSGSDIIIA